MRDDQGIQPQPRRPFAGGSDSADAERFRRQGGAPAYGWLLVLVLVLMGGAGALTCVGGVFAWLLVANVPAAPPPVMPAVAAPMPEDGAAPLPPEQDDRR